MKKLITAIFILPMLAAYGQILTNDIPISSNGMRFGLCDNFDIATNFQSVVNETQIDANEELRWFIHNTSSNQFSSVVFIGMSNSFAFELKTTNGVSISKTSKGEAMNIGPKSLTDFSGNKAIRIGLGFRDFPKLEELFEFPTNGIYLLELKYWSWNGEKRRFELSTPVRLKVIRNKK